MAKKLPVEIVISAVDEVTYKVMAINEKLKKFSEPVNKLNTAFGDLSREAGLSQIGEKIMDVGGKFQNFVSTAAKGLAVAGALGYGIYSLVESTAVFASEIGDTAERLGVSTKALQVWQFAAEQSGVRAEVVEKSMNKFTKAIGEAADGQGSAVGIFRAFGIGLKDQSGHMKTLEQILPDFADKFAAIKDPVLQNRVALELFGREGTKFASILKGGSKGLDEFRKLAEANGGILGDENIKKLHAFDDGVNMLTRQFNVFKADVLVGVLPVLMDLLADAGKFLRDNKQQVVDWALAFAKDLPGYIQAIGNLLKGIGSALRIAGDMFGWLSGILGTTTTAFLVLGGIIFGPTIAAFASLVVSIISLSATAIPAAITALGVMGSAIWTVITAIYAIPIIGWILAIIAAVIALSVVIYKYWGPISEFFTNLWAGAKTKFQEFFDYVSDKLAAFTGMLPDSLKATLGIQAGPTMQAGAPMQTRSLAALAAPNAPSPQNQNGESRITIDFMNAPKGLKTRVDQDDGHDITLGMGLAI